MPFLPRIPSRADRDAVSLASANPRSLIPTGKHPFLADGDSTFRARHATRPLAKPTMSQTPSLPTHTFRPTGLCLAFAMLGRARRHIGGLQGSDTNWHDHIRSDPAILAGKPVVRGTRPWTSCSTCSPTAGLLLRCWRITRTYPARCSAPCSLSQRMHARRAGLLLQRLARHEAARGRERPARDRYGLAALRRGCSSVLSPIEQVL